MTKEKRLSLLKYAADMKDRLNSEVPKKWEHAPVEYKAFLANEYRLVMLKLASEELTK